MSEMLERVGGLEGLTEIITDFYDRLFGDLMIGFMFRGRDKARLVKHEVQFTARLLGADAAYEGQSIANAHRPFPIMGGQFNRRLKILEETLEDHQVDPQVRQLWLEHTERLRGVVIARGRDTAGCD